MEQRTPTTAREPAANEPEFACTVLDERAKPTRRRVMTGAGAVLGHLSAVAAILVVPLLADEALPPPTDSVRAFLVTPPQIAPPPPPPPPPAPARVQAAPPRPQPTPAPERPTPTPVFEAPLEVPEDVEAGVREQLGGHLSDRLRLAVHDHRKVFRKHQLHTVHEVGPIELHAERPLEMLGREGVRGPEVQDRRSLLLRRTDFRGRHTPAPCSSSFSRSPRLYDLIFS